MNSLNCPQCKNPVSAVANSCKACGAKLSGDRHSHFEPGESDLPAGQPVFFLTSKRKFIVMNLVTLGLYQVFWTFKCWLYVEMANGRKLHTGWRSWFIVLYMLPLMREIKSAGARLGVPGSYSPGLLYVAWLALTLCAKIKPYGWLISLGAFIPLLPIFAHIEAMNRSTGRFQYMNDKYSVPNIVGIVFGSIFVLLALIGTFLPKQ